MASLRPSPLCAPVLLAALLLSACTKTSSPEAGIDSGLADNIARTSAIDNHAHPLALVGPGETDRDFDALPPDAVTDMALPSPLSPDGPRYLGAWRALFQYTFSDQSPAHLAQLADARLQKKAEKKELYPSWVLNQVHTDVMLSNRVSMGPGLPSDRFKWVPFVDMFLFPLNNTALKAKDPDHNAFIGSEERLLKRFLGAAGMQRPPGTLDDYLTFLNHTLSTWKSQNAVAIKFEFAYLRDLQISNPPKESAERVYSIYAQSSEPSPDDYKLLQDYLFRYLCRQAGQLDLPVHIHTSIGAGSYFQTSNANPLPLQSLFNDPLLRRTKFIMLHGAWPFAREAAALLLKPNVYVDYSGLVYMSYPAEAAHALRLYLQSAPERVLYGTDASPLTANIGWEDTAWAGSQIGRQTLGLALTGMLRDGEVTPERARQLAQMVLRGNAHQLYGF
jgi:uncharacterized protein